MLADDTSSIDGIICPVQVISGLRGFSRRKNSPAGHKFKQHDFKTEQASIVSPYETPFFEFEVDTPLHSHAYGAGFNSISLLLSMIDGGYHLGQRNIKNLDSTESKSNLADLNTEEFREVVKSILQACEVQGGMAKMNLAVVGS